MFIDDSAKISYFWDIYFTIDTENNFTWKVRLRFRFWKIGLHKFDLLLEFLSKKTNFQLKLYIKVQNDKDKGNQNDKFEVIVNL